MAKRLRDSGAAAAAIHGDRSQAQRERTLMEFRAGKVQTLVATDVAARGIHVDDVARVIHYDLPADIKDYVHRSGRTARAGAEGTVISFVTPDNRALADTLQRGLRHTENGARAVSYADDSGRTTPDLRAEPARGVRRDAQGRPHRREAHPGQGATRFNGPARQGRAGARRRIKPRG